MRCFACDYPLWNLDTARCPECGEAFRLSDFRFAPGSVAFACTRCGHGHAGSGPQHLPAPREGRCEGCGRAVDAEAMRVVPVGGTGEVQAAYGRLVPWVEPELRPIAAWLHTFALSATQPGELGRRVGGVTDSAPNSTYAIAAHVFTIIVIGVGVLGLLAAAPVDNYVEVAASGIGFTLLAVFILGVIAPVIVTAIWAWSAHAVLAATGRLRGTFEATLAGCFYAQGPVALAGAILLPFFAIVALLVAGAPNPGPAILTVMPCMGLVLSVVIVCWVIGLAAVILARAHNVGLPRALCAVMYAPVLATALPCVATVFL